MKITRRDLGVLMILAGILIAFLTYKLSFEKTLEEIDQLQAEQDAIRANIEKLQHYKDASSRYEKAMGDMAKEVTGILDEFPADVWQEDNIAYVVEMLDRKALQLQVTNFSAEPAALVQKVDGSGALKAKAYTLKKASVTMLYNSHTYDAMKKLINYIYKDEEHKRGIESMSMTFDKETGEIEGTVKFNQYVLTDGNKTYEEAELPTGEDVLGIDSGCIFGETETEKETEEEK